MPIALDPKATFEYILEDDRALPTEEQTIFTLRGLTVAEEARVADSMISGLPVQVWNPPVDRASVRSPWVDRLQQRRGQACGVPDDHISSQASEGH